MYESLSPKIEDFENKIPKSYLIVQFVREYLKKYGVHVDDLQFIDNPGTKESGEKLSWQDLIKTGIKTLFPEKVSELIEIIIEWAVYKLPAPMDNAPLLDMSPDLVAYFYELVLVDGEIYFSKPDLLEKLKGFGFDYHVFLEQLFAFKYDLMAKYLIEHPNLSVYDLEPLFLESSNPLVVNMIEQVDDLGPFDFPKKIFYLKATNGELLYSDDEDFSSELMQRYPLIAKFFLLRQIFRTIVRRADVLRDYLKKIAEIKKIMIQRDIAFLNLDLQEKFLDLLQAYLDQLYEAGDDSMGTSVKFIFGHLGKKDLETRRANLVREILSPNSDKLGSLDSDHFADRNSYLSEIVVEISYHDGKGKINLIPVQFKVGSFRSDFLNNLPEDFSRALSFFPDNDEVYSWPLDLLKREIESRKLMLTNVNDLNLLLQQLRMDYYSGMQDSILVLADGNFRVSAR